MYNVSRVPCTQYTHAWTRAMYTHVHYISPGSDITSQGSNCYPLWLVWHVCTYCSACCLVCAHLPNTLAQCRCISQKSSLILKWLYDTGLLFVCSPPHCSTPGVPWHCTHWEIWWETDWSYNWRYVYITYKVCTCTCTFVCVYYDCMYSVFWLCMQEWRDSSWIGSNGHFCMYIIVLSALRCVPSAVQSTS